MTQQKRSTDNQQQNPETSRLALPPSFGRRRFLKQAAFTSAMFATPGLFAAELSVTPSSRSLEGPFYPDKLPLDTDNDLLVINDSITPAVGEITHLSGRVLSKAGSPLRGVTVEIWQVDNNGTYIHSRGAGDKTRDGNFQGFGRFLTDAKGQYYFRTVKPVRYTVGGVFRTPHIHFAVNKNGHRIFTSQMLIKGHEDNKRDGLVRRIRNRKALESLLVDFKPLEDSKTGELQANFDIVLGATLEEIEEGKFNDTAGERPRRRRKARRSEKK